MGSPPSEPAPAILETRPTLRTGTEDLLPKVTLPL